MAAQFAVTLAAAAHDVALSLADAIEADVRFDSLAITVNEVSEAPPRWEAAALFATLDEADAFAAAFVDHQPVVSEIPDHDWVRQSLQGLPPVSAGRFFLYGSHDTEQRRAGGISMLIDAGTAFGTGHHQTTTGCLLALDRILKQGRPRNVFDLGCGTGVLALAAAKVLHRQVLATDIDPEAVTVTRRNASRNGAAPFLVTRTAAGLAHAEIKARAPFDLIFANILARPLAQLAQGITALLATGGQLILSGITADQEQWIKSVYCSRGLANRLTIRRGNWVTIILQK